ncbi:MAG: hypothetical protein ABWX84_03200 [Nocardioides sp.]
MITTLLVAFLVAHGLVHLAVWLPHPDPAKPAPFAPDHSAVLTRTAVPESTARQVAVALAAAAGLAFTLTAVAVAVDTGWAVPMAMAASLLGLCLKVLYFNPWLLLGLLLDAAVLVGAATWPWQ